MMLSNYIAFLPAALGLAIVPGPTVTVLIANSLKYGSKAGLLNVLGTQVGVVIWLAIAALGLNALIAVMGEWFVLLRYAGAGYLAWLAFKLFISKGDLAVGASRARPNGSFFLQGLMVIMSNPKMLLLFSGLIPPFIPAGANVMQTTIILGLIFAVIAAISDSAYALLAGRAGAWLSQKRVRAIEIFSGSCLLGGAAWMVLKGR